MRWAQGRATSVDANSNAFCFQFQGRAKTEKNRQAVEQEYLKSLHAVRQEAAAQKNSDKRRQEKERLMAEENVEKQIKLEKKMKRKDAKKAQPKMKSMSIHL